MNPAPSGTPDTSMDFVTLLVVEDEVLVRLVVADTLREAGYHVLEAANADEAVILLASFPEISLVFTDVQMPGAMDGAGLARFVRSNHPDLTVIVTSGTSSHPREDKTVVFIAKPYHPEALVREVNRLLDGCQISADA
jgi:CheY-like chemotaxis protein